MLKGLFFVLFFIWVIASIGSIVYGPFVGLNREDIKINLKKFISKRPSSKGLMVVRLGIFSVAYIGFFFPILKPVFGFLAGIFSLLIFWIISRGNV